MRKPFLRRNIQSYLFVISLTFFGIFLALILTQKVVDNNLGYYLLTLSMLLTALAMFLEIIKLNKKLDQND